MDEQRIARIEDKVDDIQRNIANINVTLVSQHESLKEHMRRTAILEEAMKPVIKHVGHVEGALKLLGGLATIAGIIVSLIGVLRQL